MMIRKTEVAVNAIVHATEDAGRVRRACQEMLGVDYRLFDVQETTGHFDNPIRMLSALVSGAAADTVISKTSAGLADLQRNAVLESLEERIDGGGLNIRLDKQELVEGRVVLGGRDAVKVRIHTPVYKKGEVLSAYADLLGGRFCR